MIKAVKVENLKKGDKFLTVNDTAEVPFTVTNKVVKVEKSGEDYKITYIAEGGSYSSEEELFSPAGIYFDVKEA